MVCSLIDFGLKAFVFSTCKRVVVTIEPHTPAADADTDTQRLFHALHTISYWEGGGGYAINILYAYIMNGKLP